MNELAERAQSLHLQIRETLLKEWDPIGVHDMDGAQDEYDAHVPAIYSFLIARKPGNEVLDYLLCSETEHMGLRADRQRTQHVAEKLTHLVQQMIGPGLNTVRLNRNSEFFGAAIVVWALTGQSFPKMRAYL